MKISFLRSLNYVGGFLLILLILAVTLYAFLPVTIKWQVNSWFEDQGLSSQIEDVEINLTDGQLIIRGFRVDDASTNLLNIGHLLINIKLRDLITKKLTLEKINIGEGYLDINRNQEGVMRVAGVVLGDKIDADREKNGDKEVGAETGNVWQVSISEILLNDIKLCYRAEETPSSVALFNCGQLSAFEWNGAASYTLHSDIEKALTEMYIDSRMSLSGFVIEDIKSGHTSARIDGLQVSKVNVEGVNNINVNGVELHRLTYLMPMPGGKASKNYEISIAQLKAGSFAVKDIHNANISTLNFRGSRLSMLADSGESQDVVRFDELNLKEISIAGVNSISSDQIVLSGFNALTSLDTDQPVGKVNYDLSNSKLTASNFVLKELQDVSVAALYVGETGFSVETGTEGRLDVMRFDELTLDGVNTDGINKISFGQINLSGYRALQASSPEGSKDKPEYTFSSKEFKARNFSISELSNISAEELRVAGLDMLIVINPDGMFDLHNRIDRIYSPANTQGKQVTKTSPVQKPDAKPVIVKIGELVIGDNSRVLFRDESVKPNFNGAVGDIRLTLRDVDMSDKDKKTWVDVSMVVGDDGKVHAKGHMQLFADRPSLDIKAGLDGINVGEFDVYANQVLKHKVKSGHMDAKLNVKIDKGQLDSKANVTLHKFYIEKLAEQDEDQYKESLGIPLSTALSLLRSRDDSIEIEIPVTGDVESPDFSLGDIIRKFSTLAIKEAVIHYYTPFGLVKLLTAGYDLATALRFEPVLFEYGQSDTDEQDKQQLGKIAVLLAERPNVHLVICGYATRQDFSTMFPGAAKDIKKLLEQKKSEETPRDDAEISLKTDFGVQLKDDHRVKLDELANNRGKSVKQYLVEQHGIESRRLILCNPKFNYADTGKARVEITI